jgi:hypothetical protein
MKPTVWLWRIGWGLAKFMDDCSDFRIVPQIYTDFINGFKLKSVYAIRVICG